MFLESGVTEHTVNGNIGIISTGDDHNYYLTKTDNRYLRNRRV